MEDEMKRQDREMNSMSERRVAPRVRPENPLPAKIRAYHPARILDISTTGSLLAITLPLKPRTSCDLRIGEDSQEIVLKGTVRRSWLKGYHSFDDGSRTTLYHAALEFDRPQASLMERLSERIGFDAQLEIDGGTIEVPIG
jgi:hypothetical protein